MADIQKRLTSKFAAGNRYANFGALLRGVRIQGFRGIANLGLSFDFPVTAFSGLNGSGKSTVGQLAVCGYRRPTTAPDQKRQYVKDFFPVSLADPLPFSADARVEYLYETTIPADPQTVTVSRAKKDWSGYKRQPERSVYYVGFSLYIPKVERRDLSIYRASTIELRAIRAMPPESKVHVGQILNQAYDDLLFQGIGHKTRSTELGIAERYGAKYSENNMGFGEGRVLYMVDLMESAPAQSLFVLEEPETSLHEDAQRRLAAYLLDACDRRHHQILLSTHSSAILEGLPPVARKLLFRDAAGVTEFPGISSTRARSILSGGAYRGLTLCVEDDFAALVLTEILRRAEPSLLKAVRIEALGNSTAVRNGVLLLQRVGLKALGVRDGDVGSDPSSGLQALPGSQAPEREVFQCPAVLTVLKSTYGLEVDAFLKLRPDLDHHDWPAELAREAALPEVALSTQAVQEYVRQLDPGATAALLAAINAVV